MQHIEDYLEETDYELSYLKISSSKEIPSHIREAIKYIKIYANFCYSNAYSDVPFKQAFWFINGVESIKIDELSEENANKLLDIINYSNNYFLKAKLYDIASIVLKNKKLKELAAQNYADYIVANSNNAEKRNTLKIAVKRALFLYNKINKTEERNVAHKIFSLQISDSSLDFALKYYVATTLSAIKSTVLKELITNIELLTTNIDMTIAPAEHFLELIEILISYYIQTNQATNYFAAIDRYVLVCIKACNLLSPHGYHYLDIALQLITKDKLKEKYIDKINDLLFMKDEEQKKIYKNMTSVESPLDDTIIADLKKESESVTSKIQSLQTGAHQLFYLLTNFSPTSKAELNKGIELRNDGLFNAVNEIKFDGDGTICYESAYATEEEKRQVSIAEILSLNLYIKFGVLLSPFIYNIKIDGNLKEIVESILDNNLFVPSDRKSVIYNIILDGFNRNIRKALYDLIPQFEYGLTQFLKSKGLYPIMYRGSSRFPIDLNHILTSKSTQNKFRSELVEIIGEDLTLELEYLLCNKYLGNIRNNNYHSGYENPEQYTIYEASAFYYIIEAYCMGCD